MRSGRVVWEGCGCTECCVVVVRDVCWVVEGCGC